MSSYSWNFSESYLGKNSESTSYESLCNLKFKQLNTNSDLDTANFEGNVNYSGYKINDYNDLAYIDLNSVHNPDASFTIEFNLTELDTIDTTKDINYLTFGYHIRGRSGVALTVGRPANSSNVVLGTITETSTTKSSSIEPSLVTEPNTTYQYTLSYNNFATNEEKLKLFRGPYLISTSSNLDIQNFSIIDRKLFLGTSGWINEPSWSNSFDISKNVVFNDYLSFQTDHAVDKSFIPSSPFYPLHYSFENITDSTRNSHQVAVKDDLINITFHSTKDVPVNNVDMHINGLSNNISQIDVQNPYLLPNGTNTVLYTYQFQVTNSWPTDGILSYGLNMYGNHTLSNILPPFNQNIYIDNTIPVFEYSFNTPSDSNVSFTVSNITDDYLSIMTNQTPFEHYTVNFYASNNQHVKSTTVNNPVINQTYFVEDLDNETIYNLYATVTDRATNTSDRILPHNGSAIVETTDITSPIIQTLTTTTITDHSEKKPGITVRTSTYDTAAALTVNSHDYTVYISILQDDISNINVIETILTSYNLFQQTKTNSTVETIEENMFTYYDSTNSIKDIVTEKMLYIYCLVIDNAGNKTFTKTSHYINNTITFTSIVSDFTTNDIAKLNNTLTMSFNSEFKLYNNNQFNITMMEDTVTNASSTDGLTWTATNIVKNTNVSGEVLFNVTQTPEHAPIANEISSFDQTDHTDSLYIQKESPVFKSGVNNTLSTGLTSLTVTNIGDYISDFTINSNNNLFKLEVTTNNETKGGVYSTKAELPSSFVFSDLDENNSYEVRASISNLFAESTDQLIGSILTQKDIPTISIETTANQITTASYPLIQLSSGSKVTEHTTPFDMYVYVADFNITDPSAIRSFLLSITPQITNHPTGTDIDIRSLIPQDITTHLSYSAGSQTYTYIFEINVQSASTNIEIASIKANGVSLHSWDKFVSVLAFIQPNHITSNDINNILVDTHLNVAWVDNILSVGDQLFQIVTTEKINTLDISPHRPLYGPGWKIYENGLVILEEVSNRGNANTPSNDGGIWYYTYVLPLNAFSQTTLIPSTTTTYYLYAMIDDTATEPVYDKKTITFDFTFTEAMLSNISYNYFVRNGDTVKMSWNTTYVSQVSDFSNVKVFGVNATPTSVDGIVWTAQVTIVDGTADHSVSYLGTPLTINASNVLYDNAAPTFTIDFVSKSTNNIQVTLDNFGSDTYTNQVVPAVITVSVVNGKFVFDHVVSAFDPSRTYIFDNTANSSEHPLNFHTSNERPEFKYTFEISVLSAHSASWIVPSHILVDGIALFENSNFDRLEMLVNPLSPYAEDMVVDHLIDSDPNSYINWRNNAQPVGTKLFNLYFKEKVPNITVIHQRPVYTPGWKIYENDVVIHTDTSNHGAESNPRPYDVTYTWNSTLTSGFAYSQDAHGYVTVSDFATHSALFVHCGVHDTDMGSDVNGINGIPVQAMTTDPAKVNTDYTVVFTVIKTYDNSSPNNTPYSFTIDYANLITNNYTLDGLEEAKDYTISCTLTDPAQNTITVNYDNGNSIQTSDVTIPTINSLTSTINTTGLNKEPGFYVSTTTYDNNEHTVHMSIFNYQLTGSDDDKKTTITTNSLSTDTITTINANVNTSNTFGTYFKTSDTTQYVIRTEETYYIYCVAVDIDGNFFISNNVKTIDNTFTQTSVVTNFSKDDIAEVGNDIIVSFTTDYRLFTDQIQVVMMGDSITPVSSDNGLTWTATNTVTSSHTSGKVVFSVSQTPDIGSTTSSFNDTSLDAVYIQKENPSFFTLPVTNNIHNIAVTLDSGKYVFTPSISSFINGHTYIFDNTGASTNSFHPLRFTSSSTHPGLDSPTILFKDDVNHIIVVTITDSSQGPIYAHCGFHSGMGSVVNGVSGIPITTLTDVSFGSLTNEIVISNIGTNINDFTINSNNDLLQLTVELGGQTITNTYANKSLIPNSFTFANLTENTQYEVKASISNLFSESNNIVLGNANTTFDFPSITVNANVSTLDDEPVVQLLTTSLATESTSAFDIYIEVTDFLFTDNTEVSTFKELLQAKLTDTSPGTNIYYVSQLDTNKLSTYWSRNGTAFVNNPLIPSTTLQYYVYAIIDDHVHIIHNRADVTFSFTASQASLSNTSYPYFTRNDDVVNMAWSTTLKSQASDFTNIKIFDQTPTPPVTTDYLNWSTSVTLPPSGVPVGTHSITYLNTSLTVNSDNVLFDNQAPTFDISLDSTTETTFNFKLTNLGSDVYTNQFIPVTGVDNTYSVVFKATHTDATLIEKTFTNITHTNLTVNTFTVDGLLEGGAYSIEATLTDPAANTKTVAYNQGNLVITNDTTLPVITNVDTLLTHVASQTTVTAVDIKAYDTHSLFDIYGGLFTTNTIDFDIQSLKDNSNTQSVIFSKTNQPTSSYVSLGGTFEKVLSYNGSSWVTNDFEYNRDYYMYIGVEDAIGNINSNNGAVFQTVTMNNGPTTSYFDPTTGTFIDPTEDGQAPQETTTTDITQDAQSALVFQPVVATDPNVDTTTDTTTYAAYDTSGNNNNIYFDAATNPLSTNAIINDYSVDIGLTTTGLALSSSLSIAGDDGFTYITHVNNTNDVFDDTVLLQNAGNDFLTVSDTGITINTGTVVFFPVSLLTNEWNSVSVSTENNTVRVFVNGEEILPTPETANNYNSAQATGTLTIPPQQNILIDGITVFNTPINAAIIETVVSSGEFKIKLDFENPPIQSFDVSYSNSKFYLNNEVSPELVFNSNAYYTFLQSSSTGIPLILSETGAFPVPNTDNLNVSYFINNVNIGNDPLKYSLDFATNDNNKVVLHTDNTSNLFYHSTTDLTPSKITVSQVAFKGIQNVANTSEAAQPVYTMTPVFTTDTKSGNHAMVFDATQQTALTFNNFTLDANNMTMSAWVKTDFTQQSNNPLISQEGVFEYGIDETGKSYFKLFNNDTPGNYATIDAVTMEDSKINISNMAFTTDMTNPGYVYAVATANKRDKSTIMSMMDTHKDTENVYYRAITTEASIPSIDLTKMFDVTDIIQDTKTMNQAYVYVSIRENNNYALGVVNQYNEYKVSFSNTVPRMHINGFSNLDVEGVQSLQIFDGTVSSGTASIDKYYSFSFLQNEDGTVGADNLELTNDLANTFINSTSFTTHFDANVTSGAIYQNDTDIPKNTVGTITNATVTQAFNSLTDATDLSNVYADSNYAANLVGVDINNNKSIIVNKLYSLLEYNNKSIFYERDLITPETMSSYSKFAIKNGFLFTYNASSIKVFKLNTNELVSVHTSTTPSTITNVISMIDLSHVVYTYNSGGYTQFRILTVDVENDLILETIDTVMTYGLTVASYMINDKYFIGKNATAVGVYVFDKTTVSYLFVESFTDFTYNGTTYTVSDHESSSSKFISSNNMFALKNTTDKSIVMFKYNGSTWNNVFNRFVVYHTDGINQYISPSQVVYSNNGNYIFIGGNSPYRKGYQTGLFYVYRLNGTEYVNTGFIAENDNVYNHFSVDISVTMDNRLFALDYAICQSSSSSVPEYSALYGYSFDKDGFDFNSSTLVYHGDKSSNNTTRVYNFFTDFYSTVFMKQNQSPCILYFREMYSVYDVRPYPPRGWINGSHVTTQSINMSVIESGAGITLVNTGHPSTTVSTWTLPESYVTYGAGQYVAKTNKSYNNGGHHPAGAFTKLNIDSPCFHTDTLSSSESDPVIFSITLPVNIIVKRYDVHSRFYTYQGIKSWKLQASNDDFVSEIVDLDSQSNQTIVIGKSSKFYIDSNTRIFKSYRLRITQNETANNSVIVSEFELWGIEQS